MKVEFTDEVTVIYYDFSNLWIIKNQFGFPHLVA